MTRTSSRPRPRPCLFTFDALTANGEQQPYEGFQYAGLWNGWPIIGVTPEVAERLLTDMTLAAYREVTDKMSDEALQHADLREIPRIGDSLAENVSDLARLILVNDRIGSEDPDGLILLDGFTPDLLEVRRRKAPNR